MPDPTAPHPPVPPLDGERAQEHDDLTEAIASTIATTMILRTSPREIADAVMHDIGPKLAELRDQYERLYGRWKGEQETAGQLRDAIRHHADRVECIPDDMFGRAILVQLAAEMRTIADPTAIAPGETTPGAITREPGKPTPDHGAEQC